MKFEIEKLNYDIWDLNPQISQETMDYHYNKHYKTYVDNLNNLIVWTEFENNSLEEIIINSSNWPIFNNAAQARNHYFYFEQFKKADNISPDYQLEIINKLVLKWGSLENFKNEFNKKAIANFWSWWTWLVLSWKDLDIINTSNASNNLNDSNIISLLVCDLWEHAYYIDYRNSRSSYLDNFWQIINWKIINERLNSVVL